MADRHYTFDDEVRLVKADENTGEEISHTSYAEIVSVYQSETYEALAVGLRPESRVILPSWHDDYHAEKRLELHGVPYRIIRAYKADDLAAELTVTRLNVPDSGTDL